MVAQNMLSAHEGKKAFSEKKSFEYSRSNQMPSTDRITEIDLYVYTISELQYNISAMI